MRRLTDLCFKRRRWVLAVWILILFGLNGIAGSVGPDFANAFSLPGSESQAAFDLLEERFPDFAGDTGTIVFQATDGIDSPGVQAEMEEIFNRVGAIDSVVSVTSPWEGGFGPPTVSDDRTIAYAEVQFDDQAGSVPIGDITEFVEATEAVDLAGLRVAAGGVIIQATQQPETGLAEIIGLLAAVLILLIAFGSLWAMGLPIITAMFGIGSGLAAMTLLTYVVSTPEFAPQMAAMIGLGVGIDYALFIVTRFRESLRDGVTPELANQVAMATAGRAVLFAGMTVVVSMLGILLMRFKFVEGLAIGSSVVVLIVMLASLTLLPAILGFAGDAIDRFHVPFFGKIKEDPEAGFWFRWSRQMQRHPAPVALISLAVLLLLSAPLLSMRMGVSDAGNDPEEYSSRQAYDMLATGFGPGFNGPFLLAADIGSLADLPTLEVLSTTLNGTEGVASASPPFPNVAGDAAIIQLYPDTAPQELATEKLLHTLRSDVIPPTLEGTDISVHIGGITPVFTDFTDKVSERLPILIGSVIGVSFLLLTVVFRSLLVPLKAALMNLLSVSAAYGVIVAVFQWGWFGDFVGIGRPGPIEAWVPMMMFAMLFGLSMDYEVFLLSRVREDYNKHGDNGLAVANGLAATARVIGAAALIMVSVFVAFMIGSEVRAIRLFALGLAVAIAVDVTIVRMALVPSTMELLGDANWWIPKWLDRLLPNVSIEGTEDK